MTSGRWRKARTTKVWLGLGLGPHGQVLVAELWAPGAPGPSAPSSLLLCSGPRKGEEEEWAPAEKISE